jgi:hypothetical protein
MEARAMVNLSFFLAVVFGCAATLFYSAQESRGGMSDWADATCSMANTLCHHSEWLAIAALVLLGVAAVLKLAG